MRILIVEDHPPIARVLTRAARQRSHKVWVSTRVRAALALQRHQQFDGIICDYELPDGTGSDVFHGLPAGQLLAFVLYTSSSLDDEDWRVNGVSVPKLSKQDSPESAVAALEQHLERITAVGVARASAKVPYLHDEEQTDAPVFHDCQAPGASPRRWTVTGHNAFPFIMLSVDHCYPATQNDAVRLALLAAEAAEVFQVPPRETDVRRICLERSDGGTPSVEAWAACGWNVEEPCE